MVCLKALRVLDCALKRTVFELTFVSKDVRLMIRANLNFSVFHVALKSKHRHQCKFLTRTFMGYNNQYKYYMFCYKWVQIVHNHFPFLLRDMKTCMEIKDEASLEHEVNQCWELDVHTGAAWPSSLWWEAGVLLSSIRGLIDQRPFRRPLLIHQTPAARQCHGNEDCQCLSSSHITMKGSASLARKKKKVNLEGFLFPFLCRPIAKHVGMVDRTKILFHNNHIYIFILTFDYLVSVVFLTTC